METSQQINEIATALAKAQADIKGASKDSTNPHFKAKYADLSSIWDACRAPLSKNGIAVIQSPATSDGQVSITTLLAHSSGQWIKDSVAVTPVKADAQGIGSAVTYLRRYSLAAMVGVAPEDDDAESAQGRNGTTKETAEVKPAPKGNGFPSPQLVDPDTGEVKHFDKASDFLQTLKTKMETGNAVNWWAVNGAAALHIANRAPDKAGEFVRKLQTMATEKDAA